MRAWAAILLVVSMLAGCIFSQSAHCGDEYVRNMTHVQNGWYELVPDVADGTDPLSGVHEIRVEKDSASQTIEIETSDGRSTRYRSSF